MQAASVTVQGFVMPDGTLELAGKVPLPAGKVQIILQTVPDVPEDDPFFNMLKDIWAARAEAGLAPRSDEEVLAVRQQLNEAMAEEIAAAKHLQDKAQ